MAITALILVACGGGGGSGASGGNPSNDNGPGTGTSPSPAVVAPTITEHPQSQSVDDGQPASFKVAATGTAPLAYQWMRNGASILGATLSTYSIDAASLADDSAQFSVIVINSAGSATSNSSSLTVIAIAPSIVTQPVAQAVLAGATATFSVTASGSQPLQYQWRRNGAAIAGANSSSYITNANALSDSGALFDAMVSNSTGSAASAGALLTVSEVVQPPEIIEQPASAGARVGGAAAFAVVATGTAPLRYQWKRNDVVIPNQNESKLIVSPVSGLNDQDRYTVTVSNAGGSAASFSATLSVTSQAGQIDLVAGLYGGPGNVDGAGGNAHFAFPADVAVDSSGNLFVADSYNATVRKMTPAGVVTTIAGMPDERGYVDASGASARFNSIHSIAADANGNIFVADSNSIRRIALNGLVTTLAGSPSEKGYVDGVGTTARFTLSALPGGSELAVAPNGDIYVGDCGNHIIRRVTQSGVVSTYTGAPHQAGSSDGPVSIATFNCPAALGFDAQGSLYVSDSGNHTVRRIAAGNVSTLAGTATPSGNMTDGVGSAAGFNRIVDLAVDSTGIISVIDSRQIRKITQAGAVTTVAGTCCGSSYDGVGTAASFFLPEGIAVDSAGNLYVVDEFVHAIRKITPDLTVSTLPHRLGQDGYSGYQDGAAVTALFDSPIGITADASGSVYVADMGNCAIRKIDSGNVVTTLVGEPNEGLGACSSEPVLNILQGISTASDGNLYVADYVDSVVVQVTPSGQVSVWAGSQNNHGFVDGIGEAARFRLVTGVAADGNGNVYVADSGNNTIRKINIASRAVSTLAGNPQELPGSADGVGSAARFNRPCGIEADGVGNVYVAECNSHTIRKISPAGVVTTLAGTAGVSGYVDGAGAGALFNSPADVALDHDGNLYVADQRNWLIRKITPTGIVSTVAGTKGLRGQALGPLPGSLNVPVGIHARTLGGGNVELLVTISHAVVRITTQ